MQVRVKPITIKLLLPVAAAFAFDVFANDIDSTYVSDFSPKNVYWGDTHLHTNLSVDAYYMGNRKLGPEEAYRFAKGGVVTAHNGMKAKLHRPLDFLVIADHASNMGVVNGLESKNNNLLNTEVGKRWSKLLDELHELEEADVAKAAGLANQLKAKGILYNEWDGVTEQESYRHSVWKNVSDIADEHNDPGNFTAFIGYEWSSLYYSLHRVVVFKDGAEKTKQTIPFSQFDSSDPEDLWVYLEDYQKRTGGEVLAIPHNGNLSAGVMFALQDAKGNPLSKAYATTRSQWEPLFEVTQIKGDSETHPLLSPTDEFADFQTLSINSYILDEVKKKRQVDDYDHWIAKNLEENSTDWMRTYEYARSGLKLGLGQQAKLGVNPFKFGMIGSTDSHTSLSTPDENNFWGKTTSNEPHKNRVTSPWLSPAMQEVWGLGWRMNAAGYAAVWAEENTRESLFAAMKRKEVYATTGPRMTVRFFGGWDYSADAAWRPDLARIGYSQGVPMGGDLSNAPEHKCPRFLIRAIKDPDGANLDRVQVIKGWRDKKGELHEKIYNVALSDGRSEQSSGKVVPVGNTVNVKNASYTNSIGDSELSVVWQDPNFDKDELAFYYVRVLEIPTPRWTAYDAKGFEVNNIPKEVPMMTQERAYTSPIWYTP